MPPPSPLPQRHGLDAAWLRTPRIGPGETSPWPTMRDFLMERLPEPHLIAQMLAAGEFVDHCGARISGDEPYRAHMFVWFHRPLKPETPVPFPVNVLEVNDRFVVADKPHFLATTPRGAHVQNSALVRLRVQLNLPELTPAHRLDRLTAGVLVFTARRRFRGAYQTLFQARKDTKTYDAIAPFDPTLEFPRRLVGRIEKRHGTLQATLVPGEPNAQTHVELVEVRGAFARYRLTPVTGKTHQLRLQMADLGLPLVGDSLYPAVRPVPLDDFSDPLQLIARRLSFVDPFDGERREYVSAHQLRWPEQTV